MSDRSRCSLDGAPRIALDFERTSFGACSLVECKAPLRDFKVDQAVEEIEALLANHTVDDPLFVVADNGDVLLTEEGRFSLVAIVEAASIAEPPK